MFLKYKQDGKEKRIDIKFPQIIKGYSWILLAQLVLVGIVYVLIGSIGILLTILGY